jgi:hypothetical protein
MPTRSTLIGAGLAVIVLVHGTLGVLTNSKPSPVPAGTAEATKAAAERVGADVRLNRPGFAGGRLV